MRTTVLEPNDERAQRRAAWARARLWLWVLAGAVGPHAVAVLKTTTAGSSG